MLIREYQQGRNKLACDSGFETVVGWPQSIRCQQYGKIKSNIRKSWQ
jgi:hypothetical protein